MSLLTYGITSLTSSISLHLLVEYLVFASKVGSKNNASNLRRAFYHSLKQVEIDNFTFHDLRHTFATRLS